MGILLKRYVSVTFAITIVSKMEISRYTWPKALEEDLINDECVVAIGFREVEKFLKKHIR